MVWTRFNLGSTKCSRAHPNQRALFRISVRIPKENQRVGFIPGLAGLGPTNCAHFAARQNVFSSHLTSINHATRSVFDVAFNTAIIRPDFFVQFDL